MKRCKWCNTSNPRYIDYHDNIWGKPNFDSRYMYMMFILESFQAGLSWETILNKIDAFKEDYDDFDIVKVKEYNQDKIDFLCNDKRIIRNKSKILASISNSKLYFQIEKEYGSFYDFLKIFTKGKTYYEIDKVSSPLSIEISLELKRRGFKYCGPKIIYSYLQAIGIIYSHDKDCYLYKGNNN